MDERYHDQARELTERRTAEAVSAVRNRAVEAPLEVAGVRLCLDCRDPVGVARLQANPHAVRCIDCQTDHDRRA
jgi:phage/conjugal plasmid C-4 type zinc finger TraR family protein